MQIDGPIKTIFDRDGTIFLMEHILHTLLKNLDLVLQNINVCRKKKKDLFISVIHLC